MSASYHMVHYRRFIGSKDGAVSLEALCRQAMGRKDPKSQQPLWLRPEDRIMKDNGETGHMVAQRQFLMNRVADLRSAMFGEICAANEKDLQALLRMEKQTKSLSSEAKTVFFDLSETEAPKGARFIRGIGYWFAVGNHLFFLTLQSFTARQVSEYLNWLLGAAAAEEGVDLSLNSYQLELDAAIIGERGVGDIKSLRISGNSAAGISVPVAKEEAKPKKRQYSRRVKSEHKSHSAAKTIIDAVLGPAQAERLLSNLGPDEYVTAEAEIRVRGSKTEATLENVRKIATAIADETDAHVEVEGKYGKIRDGDAILRMKMPFAVSNEGGTLLDFDNVADQIQEVYKRFIQDGKIKV